MAKILIIDDDPDIADSMGVTLQAHSYEVETAGGSEEGLHKVKEFEPDLVILDVMMETTTAGFHVAYQLRNADPASSYAKYSKIPILMITSVSKQTQMLFNPEEDGEYMPVDGYIQKPVMPAILLEKIKELLDS